MKQLFLLILTTLVAAQNFTLEQALSLAESSSAELRAIEIKVNKLDSTSSLFTTGANPELEVGTENLGKNEVEIVVSQELRFASQKQPALRELELLKRETALPSEAIRRELNSKVIENYLTIPLLQEASAPLLAISCLECAP